MDYTRVGRGYVEVDLDAITSNLIQLKKHIANKTKIIGVIKTDGYGHGSIPLAKAMEKLEFMGGLAVATEEEAMELTQAGIRLPIMILGYTFPYAYEEMAEKGIEPTVFRQDMLLEMSEAAIKTGKSMRVHIKVDTGMSRIGILPDDTGVEFVKMAAAMKGIEVVGIFTHFATADESDKTLATKQLSIFKSFLARVRQIPGLSQISAHCSNSAAILEMPDADLDAVRAGIAMYGLRPSEEVDMSVVNLRPALSFYSTVVYVKEVPAGTCVSYGATYVTKGKMKIATVPIGYGDGYPRSLSGRGYVLIRGYQAPILGRVCMDQMMVDVTGIPEIMEGDKVTLIGKDGTESISADYLGELSGKFNYELICGLGKRIPRVYIGG